VKGLSSATCPAAKHGLSLACATNLYRLASMSACQSALSVDAAVVLLLQLLLFKTEPIAVVLLCDRALAMCSTAGQLCSMPTRGRCIANILGFSVLSDQQIRECLGALAIGFSSVSSCNGYLKAATASYIQPQRWPVT
jgi:hypothetical protein